MPTVIDQNLGQWLCERGALSSEQLDRAREIQSQTEPRPRLVAVLASLKLIDEAKLADLLAEWMGSPLWDPDQAPPQENLRDLLPATLAQTHRLFPLARENGWIRCVTDGPIAPADRAKIEFVVNQPIQLSVAPESIVSHHLQSLYGLSVESMIADLKQSASDEVGGEEIYRHDLRDMAQEPTLINLVNIVISNAIEERASDIHIEPFESEIKLKYRIDGILHEIPPPPKHLQSAIISRVKIMAGMDIAERYIPQDGQIRVTLPSGQVDIRVSTVPTIYGESVVMRLLNKDDSLLKLTRLGMSVATHNRFSQLLHRPHGILLVCGPTGSGKTTTLYSGLNEIFTPAKKIITIEDPVEYKMHGVNQIPVRPKRGLDFASGLRSILRQDPDIIMVGEIRDRETADIAIRAALTGHLVFSTLHTNDSAGAVTRLVDMGVEPFLISSSLQGALAQRLVRRLCPECRKRVACDPALAAQFGADASPEFVYEPAGCTECHGWGFHGRIGIFELLVMNQHLHDLILQGASTTEVRATAAAHMQTMVQDGWEKIRDGVTTISEVLQATQFEGSEAA